MAGSRSSSYIGLLFATFLALVWVMWSGLSLVLPETDEPVCECNSQFHLISHRGGAASAPENTMAAFRATRKLTPDISMDLAITSDRQLVLMHDDYVDRTTDGKGVLCEKTLDEVKSLDAGSWFSARYDQERVPMLSELFAEFGNTTQYHIDLKWPNKCSIRKIELLDKAVQVIRSFGLQANVAFTLDDADMLQLLKQQLPEALVLASINVLYTLAPLRTMWTFVEDNGADGVSAHFLMPMLKNVVVEAKKRQKKVFIYTVDSLYVSRWLECLGVDAIITNMPQKIVDESKCPVYQGSFNVFPLGDELDHDPRRGGDAQHLAIAQTPHSDTKVVDDGHWIPL